MIGRVEITNKLVAKQLGIEVDKVASVMDFFYKELAIEFQECNHPFLSIKNLGTFVIKLRAINNRLYKLNRARRAWKALKPAVRKEKGLKTISEEMFKLFEIRRKIKRIRNEKIKANTKG